MKPYCARIHCAPVARGGGTGCGRRRGARPSRRGQRLHLSRSQADPAAVRRLHQGHRHQGQRDLGELRPRAAHQDRRRQQPGRRAADRRHRPPRGGGARRHHPADQVGRARQGRGAAIPRSGRPLVRHLDARARRLRLEGAREAERHHLRGTRRSEMEGQDLHPLRPAHLQQRAVRGLYRQARRSQGRGMAARPQGQSGAEAVRRRPRDRARRRGRQVRPRHRQHLLLGADAQQGSRPASRGRRRPR